MTLLDISRMRTLYSNGQYQDAFNLYRLLLVMRENDAESCLLVLGLIMRKLGRAHEAAQLATAFLDGLPEYPDLKAVAYGAALYNRALAYQYLGRLDDCWNDLGRGARRLPG